MSQFKIPKPVAKAASSSPPTSLSSSSSSPSSSSLSSIKNNSHKRLLIADINESITCPLCHGYLIEATTINDCLHSFCRSCIIKHLAINKYCPCCPTTTTTAKTANKPIQETQLRPDNQLKTLVYKLVSGLYQSEQQRIQRFNVENNIRSSSGQQKHASHLNSDISSHHERRQHHDEIDDDPFGKAHNNNNNNNNQRKENNDVTFYKGNNDDVCEDKTAVDDDVEFFSPDDPISLSLEYHPKSVIGCDKSSLPQVRYLQCPAAVTINHLKKLLASTNDLNFESPNIDIQIIYEDEILPAKFNLMDVAYCYNWKKIEVLKLFYQIFITAPSTNGSQPSPSPPTPPPQSENVLPDDDEVKGNNSIVTDKIYSNNAKIQIIEDTIVETKLESYLIEINAYDVCDINSDESFNSSTSDDDEPLKKIKIKRSNSKTDKVKQNSSSPKTNTQSDSKPDFKSLRSNDIKFTEVVEVKNYGRNKSEGSPPQSDGTKQQNSKHVTEIKTEEATTPNALSVGTILSADDVFSNMKKVQKEEQRKCDEQTRKDDKFSQQQKFPNTATITSPNIVVSIPQSGRKSLNDDNYDNLSLSSLKTANKKQKTNTYKHSTSVDESLLRKLSVSNGGSKPEIPKLKIEISKLPIQKSKSVNEARKSFDSDRHYHSSQDDLTEYAKNIGLKPVLKEKEQVYDLYEISDSPYKKRKKNGKHSKDLGSDNSESLKLKVKRIGNKTGKQERKGSSSSDDNGSSASSKSEVFIDNSSSSSGTKNNVTPTIDVTKEKLLELRQVRHKPSMPNMPILSTVLKSEADKKPISNSTVTSSSTASSSLLSTTTTNTLKTTGSQMFNFIKPKTVLPDLKKFKFSPPKTYLPGTVMPRPFPPDIRPQVMFSPPHVPNYPTFTMPKPKVMQNISPRLLPISSGSPTAGIRTNLTYQQSLKRSISLDSPIPAKTLKLEPISRKSIPNLIQASPVRVQTPALPLTPPPPPPAQRIQSVKTETVTKPTESYYNSEMSSSYTREITTKKPIPMLLPPSSISVTKMTDLPKPIQTMESQRPALEIVRISSSVPTVDQQHQNSIVLSTSAMATSPKPTKATRPPPQTIPLVKIRKASIAAQKQNIVDDINEIPSPKYDPVCDNIGALDLSGKTGRSPSPILISASPPPPPLSPQSPKQQLQRKEKPIVSTNTATTTATTTTTKPSTTICQPKKSISPMEQQKPYKLESSIAKMENLAAEQKLKFIGQMAKSAKSLNNIKSITASSWTQQSTKDRHTERNGQLLAAENRLQNLEMLSDSALNREKILTSSPPLQPTTSTITTTPRQLAMPKLNEINKIRNTAVRQQNASVRNIPNPSALAFRNHVTSQQKTIPSLVHTIAVKNTKPTTIATSSPNANASNTGSTLITPKTTSTTQFLLANNKSTTTALTSISTTATKATSAVAINTSLATVASSTNTASPSPSSSSTKSSSSPTVFKQSSAANSTTNNINNIDANDAKLIAAKKNLHIEKLAASLRAAAASDNGMAGSSITTVA